jgi:hypothetical protein
VSCCVVKSEHSVLLPVLVLHSDSLRNFVVRDLYLWSDGLMTKICHRTFACSKSVLNKVLGHYVLVLFIICNICS